MLKIFQPNNKLSRDINFKNIIFFNYFIFFSILFYSPFFLYSSFIILTILAMFEICPLKVEALAINFVFKLHDLFA